VEDFKIWGQFLYPSLGDRKTGSLSYPAKESWALSLFQSNPTNQQSKNSELRVTFNELYM
jgi:hypothetical protein